MTAREQWLQNQALNIAIQIDKNNSNLTIEMWIIVTRLQKYLEGKY